jgi:hypothetical protein
MDLTPKVAVEGILGNPNIHDMRRLFWVSRLGEGRWNVPQDDDDDNSDEQTNLVHLNDGGVGGGESPTHVVDVWITKDSLNGDLKGKNPIGGER